MMMSTEGETQTVVLSSLPENVLVDEVLGRLPLGDIVRTSILSKKWRYTWCRVPQLTLDETLWESTLGAEALTIKFNQIINHLLTFHAGSISKFILLIPCLDEISPEIDNLINFLSTGIGIQHLVLQLPCLFDPYKLHSSFFTCLQLRHQTLENCQLLPPSTFKGFDRLISLELRYVSTSSKILETLISHCPLLEQLLLHNNCRDKCVIQISAPLLRSFDFRGSISSICLKNIPLLEKLSLEGMEYYAGSLNYDIINFFESFSFLEHVQLNNNILKFLAANTGDEVSKKLPADLKCVKRLYLSNIFLGDLAVVSCALCLIRSFPYLQYLEIEVADDYTRAEIPALECLEVEGFSNMPFSHLSEVKLQGSLGTKPARQLVKLLLAKSRVLVTMIIEHIVQSFQYDPVLEAFEFGDVLHTFQRASPKAKVVHNVDWDP